MTKALLSSITNENIMDLQTVGINIFVFNVKMVIILFFRNLCNKYYSSTGSKDGFVRLWKCSNGFKTLEPLFTVPVVSWIHFVINFTMYSFDSKKTIFYVHLCGLFFTIFKKKVLLSKLSTYLAASNNIAPGLVWTTNLLFKNVDRHAAMRCDD